MDFEKIVYGNFLNFVPRHYVFEGFKSSEEFGEHLVTLLEWKTKSQDGLEALGIEATPGV